MDEPIPKFVAHYRAQDGCYQSVKCHLMGTAKRTTSLCRKIGFPLLGELIGLVHDLGKYSQAFQTYLKSALGKLNPDMDEWVEAKQLKGKIDHSSAGAQFIWNALGVGRGTDATIAGQLAALCVASHHSGLIDCLNAVGEDTFTARMNKEDDRTHLSEVLDSADPEILQRAQELLNDPELLSEGQRMLSAIEARNPSPEFKVPQLQQLGLWVRFTFSCLIAADRIDTAIFENPGEAKLRQDGAYTGWPLLIVRLEQMLAAFPDEHPVDHLRRDISQECLHSAARGKGIYTLTVPTGGGKTLASLRFALHHAEKRKLERVVYIIPFTSIIDQNASRVRDILEPKDAPADAGRIVLEHHSNIQPDRQTAHEKILSQDWDAPVVYTTMVQFLEALFGRGTRGARRMHQLANAVLVFDEVQTLPVRCVHLFSNAVNFLVEQCNSTAVLCTATQPLLDRVNQSSGAIRLAQDHSMIGDVRALFDQLQRVQIIDGRKPGHWHLEEIAALALAELERNGSCLIIANTKRAARILFERLAVERSQEQVFHLSTNMCPTHRRGRLDEIISRLAAKKPVLCVSTQLIEAGVDVDFGCVIRFLAGLDSIAQAAGRCNRNGNRNYGPVYIVNPEENLGMLPDIAEGKEQAQRVLDNYALNPAAYGNDILGPKAIEEYYRYYFFKRVKHMSYPLPRPDTVGVDTTLLQLVSLNETGLASYRGKHGHYPPYRFRQAFATAAEQFAAIDAPTEGIVVPYGPEGEALINDLCSADDLSRETELLRRAQQYTVNVFPNLLHELESAKAFFTIGDKRRIHCLLPQHYSDRFGLSPEAIHVTGAYVWDDDTGKNHEQQH